MKIVTKKVGEMAKVKEVKNLSLEMMQSLVGGLIQPIYIEDSICWCNEEGKLLGMDVNLALTTDFLGEIVDTVNGDVFFTSADEENEGLNDRQIQSILEKVNDGICTLASSDMHFVPILII